MQKIVFICFVLTAVFSFEIFGQGGAETDETDKIRVFLDCFRCNENYIHDEIKFVNFVRDKEDSQVHLLITRENSGSGTEFKLQVIGREQFLGEDNTITYFSYNSDTNDEERKGLVRFIKSVLFNYVSTTKAINNIDIVYTPEEEGKSVVQEDPWNSWIFELDGRTSMEGEESRKSIDFSGGISAERVTKDLKTTLRYDYDYNRRTFSDINSAGNNVESVFITRSHRFWGNHVIALTEHWSSGIFTEVRNSTRNNYDLNLEGNVGIEYNIFPYEEYSEREFSFVYMVGTEYRDYTETTIYLKDEEMLYGQEISSRVDFTQPWGGISGRADFRTLFNDLQKNRLNIDMRLNFRVFRGLELFLSGEYSIINDQLNITGDVSDEEQLLDLQEQSTSYSYEAFIGLSYTFGSIFNQAVNPRF